MIKLQNYTKKIFTFFLFNNYKNENMNIMIR